MHRLRFILAAMGMLTAMVAWAAEEPAKPATKEPTKEKAKQKQTDPAKAELDRVAKLTPAEQQAWLKQLEQRAWRAARLSLGADEAKYQFGKIRTKLHQKTVSWKLLEEVVQDVDTREKSAIDRLVRQYRGLVFDTFHKQMTVYAERQQAWVDVHVGWTHAGSRFDQQEMLLDWLEAAVQSANPKAPGPLPAIPKFDDQGQTDKNKKKPAKDTQPVELPDTKSQPTPGEKTDEKDSVPQKPKPIEKSSPSPGPVATRSVASDEATTAREMKKPANVEKPSQAVRKSVAAPKPAVKKEATEKVAKKETVVKKPQSEPKVERRDVAVPTAVVVQASTAGASRERIADTAVAAVAHNVIEEPSPETVEIKVDELSARIKGFNLTIRTLEGELNEKEDWNAAQLESLADRFSVLVTRRGDLNLFRQAVPERQQQAIDQLVGLKGVFSLFAGHIAAARRQAEGLESDTERQTELKRLDEVSRRLAQLAEK